MNEPTAPAPTIRKADRPDQSELAAVLARAFDDDPVLAWLLPDEASRPRRMERVFHTYLQNTLRVGDVFTTTERTGAALWKPPGKWKLGNAAIARQLPQLLRAFGRRIPAVLEFEHKVESQHPTEPHWYLAVLGTDPVAQGKGIGAALVRQVTDRCDRDGLPAYLESSKPDNVPYYERFGFKVTGETALGKDGPSLWFMWREPQAPDA